MKDSVDKILQRSRELTKSNTRLSLKYRQKLQKMNSGYNTKTDLNLLSDRDWQSLLSQRGKLSKSQRDQVRYTIVNQGVPDEIRGQLWVKLLDIDQAEAVYSGNLYANLCQFTNEEAENQIDKDIDRTLGHLNLWQEEHNQGNNKLFNVLKAYANYDNEVSYVQGMNYIVGLFLFYIPDDE